MFFWKKAMRQRLAEIVARAEKAGNGAAAKRMAAEQYKRAIAAHVLRRGESEIAAPGSFDSFRD